MPKNSSYSHCMFICKTIDTEVSTSFVHLAICVCACCTFFLYSEYVLNTIFSFISQQSVILSASLIKDPVQLLTRVPVLIHIRVHYAMEVSKHTCIHIFFHENRTVLDPIESYF